MNHISRFAVLLAMAVAMGDIDANALNVTVTPGELQQAVGTDADATALTVSGTVDIRDFQFIMLEMPELVDLDLSGATVTAYDGDATFWGHRTTVANEVPECALMSTKLQRVVLPSGITSIADGAFGGSALQSVVIPATVEAIGNNAFAECNSLTSIDVPASVTHMGEGVFKGCAALQTATVSAQLTALPAETFSGCTSLTTCTLPATMATISADAFNGCEQLGNISFPTALEQIGARAFCNTALSTADFSQCSKLNNIGEWAFVNCPSLTNVTFNNGLQRIGVGAFFNDNTLDISSLPQQLVTIDDFALHGIGETNYNVLTNTKVETIGNYGIANWRMAQALVLPATISKLGDGAMARWTALQQIDARKLGEVPALGVDVWEGVRKDTVALVVTEEMMQAFKRAEQWEDFDITSKVTGVDEVVNDAVAATVRWHFEGLTLIVESDIDISGVQLYDVQGRSFMLPGSGVNTTRVSIDTNGWDSRVMVVRVMLSDNTAATLKLVR